MSKQKKIKIMFFFSGLKSGGAEQVIYNYCKYLENEKYDFIVVYQHQAVQTCLEKFINLGCKTERITARVENPIKSMVDTVKMIKKYNPDIVHANTNLMNWWSLLPAKILGVRGRISHSHIAEKDKSKVYRLMAVFFKMLTLISANELLACGKEAGEYLYGKHKFIILNNAIDFKNYVYTENNFRKELRLDDKIIIGHAGRFSTQKNHKRVIDIFETYYRDNLNSSLLLAGTGELFDEIKKYVHEKNLEDAVVFLGVIEEMNTFYSAIDVFILPSLFEGLPVVALETQVAGKPTVLSDKIDSNVAVTELVHMLPLTATNDEWKEAIDKSLKFDESISFKKKLMEAGYNVEIEVVKLKVIYNRLNKRR